MGMVAVAVAGITAMTAMSASAHHCYKEEWQDAALQALQRNNTAWVSLADLGRMFLVPAELQEPCGWVADEAVADWMKANGMTQMPMIHSKATTGGGAYYKKGKEPKPFNYLTDAQFDELGVRLFTLLDTCVADLEG